jgi:hypothetical protein
MKNTKIKFSAQVNACLNAIMIPHHSGMPKNITFKTVLPDENEDGRTMTLQIPDEEDAFITEQATNLTCSKAEIVEAILESCFKIGITEQGKKWVVDAVLKDYTGKAANFATRSKQSFVVAIIRFIMSLHPKSQNVQKTLQEQAVKVRGLKRNYSKSKT